VKSKKEEIVVFFFYFISSLLAISFRYLVQPVVEMWAQLLQRDGFEVQPYEKLSVKTTTTLGDKFASAEYWLLTFSWLTPATRAFPLAALGVKEGVAESDQSN
jgi:hypothetical protein